MSGRRVLNNDSWASKCWFDSRSIGIVVWMLGSSSPHLLTTGRWISMVLILSLFLGLHFCLSFSSNSFLIPDVYNRRTFFRLDRELRSLVERRLLLLVLDWLVHHSGSLTLRMVNVSLKSFRCGLALLKGIG